MSIQAQEEPGRWSVGDEVQVQKGTGKWFLAEVSALPRAADGYVKVHFPSLPNWDEWIQPEKLRRTRGVHRATKTASNVSVDVTARKTLRPDIRSHSVANSTGEAGTSVLRHGMLVEERQEQARTQDRLSECFRMCEAERESREVLSSEIRAVLKSHGTAIEDDRNALEKVVKDIKELQDSFRALESDFSDQQTSMHMVMDMMESCVDGKEARELVAGCMERIESSEASFNALVEETVASMTGHVDSKVNESVRITKASIDGIESLEARMDRGDAEIEAALQQLKHDAEAQSAADRDYFTTALVQLDATLNDRLVDSTEEGRLTAQTLEEQLLRRLELQREALESKFYQIDEKYAEGTTQLQSLMARVDTQLSEQIQKCDAKAERKLVLVSDQLEQLDSKLAMDLSQAQTHQDSQRSEVVSALKQDFASAIGSSETAFNNEIRNLGESFRSLCLKLAREIDSKVSALDEKCTQKRVELKQSTDSELESRDISALATQSTVDQLTQLLHTLQIQQEQVSVKHTETSSQHNNRMVEIEQRIESGRQYFDDVCFKIDQTLKAVSSALDEHRTHCASANKSLDTNLQLKVKSLEARLQQQQQSTDSQFECHCRDLDKRLAQQATNLLTKLQDLETTGRAEANSIHEAMTNQLKLHITEHHQLISKIADDIRDHKEHARLALERRVAQCTDQVSEANDAAIIKLESVVNANREASVRGLDQVNAKLTEALETAGRSTSELLATQSQVTTEAAQRTAEELQSQIRTSQAEQSQLALEYTARFDTLEQTILQMERMALDQATSLSRRMTEQMQTDMATLRTEVDDVATSLNRQLREATDSLEVQLGQVEAETHAAHASRLAELAAQVNISGASLSDRLTKLQAEQGECNDTIRAMVDSARQDIEQHGTKLAEAATGIGNLNAAIHASVDAARERADDDKVDLVGRIAASELKLSRSVDALAEGAREIVARAEWLDTQQIELKREQEELKAQQSSSQQRAEHHAEDIDVKLHELQNSMGQLAQKVETVENKHTKVCQSLAAVEASNQRSADATGERFSILTSKLEDVVRQAKTAEKFMESAIDDLKSTVSRDFDAMEEQLAALQQALDSTMSATQTTLQQQASKLIAAEHENEQRHIRLADTIQRTIRERAEKTGVQVEQAASAQRTSAENVITQIRELHDRISTSAVDSDNQLQEFRIESSSRTEKVEQQLEWYMRYSKTLSTLVGDLESKLSILQQAQGSQRDDILKIGSVLESNVNGSAETPHTGTRAGKNRPSATPRFRSSRSAADSSATTEEKV